VTCRLDHFERLKVTLYVTVTIIGVVLVFAVCLSYEYSEIVLVFFCFDFCFDLFELDVLWLPILVAGGLIVVCVYVQSVVRRWKFNERKLPLK
jgi:hypothetical protein